MKIATLINRQSISGFRQKADRLCWGNRSDLGQHFIHGTNGPRTPYPGPQDNGHCKAPCSAIKRQFNSESELESQWEYGNGNANGSAKIWAQKAHGAESSANTQTLATCQRPTANNNGLLAFPLLEID